MDAVAAPTVGSEATAGTNQIPESSADGSAQSSRRYQPLVVLTLAVAAGMIWSRYVSRQIFPSVVASTLGAGWFLVWWCLCAACLVAWLLARRRRCDGHAAWILLAAAVLAGSAWHELNWFLYDADEIGRYAAFEPRPLALRRLRWNRPSACRRLHRRRCERFPLANGVACPSC